VKLLGPVQLKLAFAVSLDPVRLRVLPEQMGPLLEALFPVGEEGFFKMNGPSALEIHPSSVTVMFLYSPADSLSMVMVPVVDDLALNEILLPAGLVYCTL